MRLKQLQYLIKVVECGSITQAAQQLYVSQPSLTKSILSLEEEYHIQILVRKPRGIELTAEGRDFVHYARGVLSAVDALKSNSSGSEPPKSRLFIATQQLDFVYDLFVQACRYHDSQNLHYNLVETDRNDVVQQVLDGHVDLGLTVRASIDAKNFLWNTEAKRLEVYVIDTAPVFLAVGPDSPLYDRDTVSGEEILPCMQVALDMESQAKQAVHFDATYTHFNKSRIIFCNTVSACEHFLLNTDAVSFVSPWTGGCYKDPRIRIIPVSTLDYCNELLWVKRIGEPLSDTESFFISGVYRHLGKQLPPALAQYAEKQTSIV